MPLLWSAAGVDETSPVLDWLASVAGTMHQAVEFHVGVVNPADAVRVGFAVLRTAMRSWGISSPPDLSLWFRDPGFAMIQPGNHIPARAPEFVIGEACRFDARVALLEACYVRVTLHVGQQMAVPPHSVPVGVTRRVETGASVGETQRWAQLDAVELNDWMMRRVPMLKTCLRFIRGRFRQCWGTVLKERCRARLAGDVVSASRGWKLFCLVPFMLLHREVSGSVGRDELAQRVADFEGGRWIQLLDAASAFTPARPRQTTITAEEEQKRRGLVVQSRIQRGQVSRARQELTGAALAPKNEETLQELRKVNVLKCRCDQSHLSHDGFGVLNQTALQ